MKRTCETCGKEIPDHYVLKADNPMVTIDYLSWKEAMGKDCLSCYVKNQRKGFQRK